MYKYRVTFITTSGTVFFMAASRDPETIQNFIEDLLLIFSEFDEEKELYNVKALHTSTPQLLAKTDELVLKYSPRLPAVNKVGAYLSKLQPDQNFFFFPKEELSTREIMNVQDYLRSLDENQDFEEIRERTREYWGDLWDNYSIDYCGGTKRFIGEPIRKQRICRFCGKGYPATSFKKTAHAISEGLGNKQVILWDECDRCNEDFGLRLEPSLIEYLSLFRTFYGASKGEKAKVSKGTNFSLRNDGSPTINIFGERFQKQGEFPYTLDLIGQQKIVSQNIYKSLCKFALSIMDKEYLQYFKRTIDWVSSDEFVDRLPPIGEAIHSGKASSNPTLYLMMRQVDKKNLPFAVGVLQYTCKMMMFILPFSTQDDQEFLNDDHIEDLRKIFKPFSSADMTFNDFSNYNRRTLDLHLIFNKE